MCFFAEDRELAWLTGAAGYADYGLYLWKWLEVSLHNAACQQNTPNRTNRWWSKVTGPYSTGTGLRLWLLTLGESPRVQTRAFLTWDQRSPWLWRRQESQIWCQASTSSGTCCCSNPSGQGLFSSENRSRISKTRRKPTAFSHFLSRNVDCLPSQLKAPQSLGLDSHSEDGPLTGF